MATDYTPNWRSQLTGGIVRAGDSWEVPTGEGDTPGAFLTAHNVRIRESYVEMLGGALPLGAVAAGARKRIVHLANVRDPNDDEQLIVCTPDRVLQMRVSGVLQPLNAADFGLDPLERWASDVLLGTIILVHPGLAPQKWLGPGEALTALGGDPPRGSGICEFAGHVILTRPYYDDTEHNQMIAGSGLHDAEDWAFDNPNSDADKLQYTAGGDMIQLVLRMGDYAALYKEKSISLMSYLQAETATYGRQGLTDVWGACSRWAAVELGRQVHAVMSRENFLLLNPAGPEEVGDAVWRWFAAQFAQNKRGRVWAAHNRVATEVVWCYPSVGEGADGAIVLHPKARAFTTRDWPYTAAATVRLPTGLVIDEHTELIDEWLSMIDSDSEDAGDRWVAGDAEGQVWALDATDAGAGTTAVLETGDTFHGDPNAIKQEAGLLARVQWSGQNPPQWWVAPRMSLEEPVVWRGPYSADGRGKVPYHCKGRVNRYKLTKTGGTMKLHGFAPLVRTVGSL